MVKRKTAVVLAGLSLLTAVVLVPTASAAGPQLLAPAQAQALVSAVPTIQTGSVTRPASPQEALASGSTQGANVAVAPGMSASQAVGLVPLGQVSPAAPSLVQPAAATAATSCWATTWWRQWGTWPYEQKIADTTYWCAVYGDHVTYYSSTVNGTGTFCGTSWTSSQLISGGIGYTWFVLRSSAGFSCPTVIPWVTLHPSHYTDVSRNDWGTTSEVASN